MKEVLSELERWQEGGEDTALATLVSVRGSAPRLPGARLGLSRSGRMSGSVSGGCVESDVFERALQVLDAGMPVVATYGVADETAWQVGLACGGTIDVLIEPFVLDAVWRALREAVAQQRPAALAVGVAPAALLGRKCALVGDTTVGSIDTELDPRVASEAGRLLLAGGTRVLVLPWRGEEATIFVEAFPPPLRLFIIGATHTAVALCRLAKEFGFHVTVVDPRSAYATRERFPAADALCLAAPDEILDRAALDAYAYVVLLTHDPTFDHPALARALRSPARYIGVMGSARTQARRRARLEEEGFGTEDMARMRAPIGLDIGARTPEEIALAILAEILAVRSGRDGQTLTGRRTPIHGG